MTKDPMPKTRTVVAVTVAVAFVAACVAFAAAYRARAPRRQGVPVPVRDRGSGRSKCYSCEADAGVQGTVTKCLDCQGPSFRYLTETIIAERGAAENGACLGCRGAP